MPRRSPSAAPGFTPPPPPPPPRRGDGRGGGGGGLDAARGPAAAGHLPQRLVRLLGPLVAAAEALKPSRPLDLALQVHQPLRVAPAHRFPQILVLPPLQRLARVLPLGDALHPE